MRFGPQLGRLVEGSTLVIVLWISLGLVSMALYFANSMSLELKAADYRVCGLAADQAIEGAARYVASVLANAETNGIVPDPATYLREAVPVGVATATGREARFWLIGRETNSVPLGQVEFGLVDEASKLNLNSVSSNMLIWVPGITEEMTIAILDWRDTNGGSGAYDMFYGMAHPPYLNKAAFFETVDELRMVYGAEDQILFGEDTNRNGVLDPNETDSDRNGTATSGLIEFFTVYTREPNTYSNGVARVDIRQVGSAGPFQELLQSGLGSSRAEQILTRLGVLGGGTGGPGGGIQQRRFRSPLELYRESGMTAEEFALVEHSITTTTNTHIVGRVNINSASTAVLACLPGLSESLDLADLVVKYREANPSRPDTVAWIVDALGSNNARALDQLARSDCLTTRSYQYSADIAALGPYGRGFRRTRLVFDTADGAPRIIYRQDLTHLGWALGTDVREAYLNRIKTPL